MGGGVWGVGSGSSRASFTARIVFTRSRGSAEDFFSPPLRVLRVNRSPTPHPQLPTPQSATLKTHPVKSVLLLLLGFAVAAALSAQTEPILRIGTITIHPLDVYSAAEAGHGPLYKLADRLHIETRKSVIEKFLLFHEGDPYSPSRLAETERNLRALGFLKSDR